jgi:hypothetical protein
VTTDQVEAGRERGRGHPADSSQVTHAYTKKMKIKIHFNLNGNVQLRLEILSKIHLLLIEAIHRRARDLQHSSRTARHSGDPF